MEGFTLIDLIVAGVIVVSAILAYSRGLVREITAILGWIAAGVLAFIFAPEVEPLMREIPVLGDFLAGSCELSIVAAFAAVFALALVVLSFFTPLFASLVQGSALGGLDQGLGFLFGALRGILLVIVGFIVYDLVMTEAVTMVDQSRSEAIFESAKADIYAQLPEQGVPDWIGSRYEQLVGECGGTAA